MRNPNIRRSKRGDKLKPLKIGPSCHKVNSRRNSACGSARLEDLKWTDWWTDSGFTAKGMYLHVSHIGTGGHEGTSHRVYCKLTETPRLMLKNGELYWLVDKEK